MRIKHLNQYYFLVFVFSLIPLFSYCQQAIWERSFEESRITEIKRAPDQQNYFYIGMEKDEYCNTFGYLNFFDSNSGHLRKIYTNGGCSYSTNGTNNSSHGFVRNFNTYPNGLVSLSPQFRHVEYGSNRSSYLIIDSLQTKLFNGYFKGAPNPSSPINSFKDTLYFAKHSTAIHSKTNSNIIYLKKHKDSLQFHYYNYIKGFDTILNYKANGERAELSRVFFPYAFTITTVTDSAMQLNGEMRMHFFDLRSGKHLQAKYWPHYGRKKFDADSMWFESESEQVAKFNLVFHRENTAFIAINRFDLTSGEVLTTDTVHWSPNYSFAKLVSYEDLHFLLLNDSTKGYVHCYNYKHELIWKQTYEGFKTRKVFAICPLENGFFLGGSRDGFAFLTKQAYPKTLTDAIEQRDRPNFNVFPNPAQAYVTIENPFKLSQVSLYSLSGSLIKQQSLNGFRDRFSLENIPNGLYLLIIEANEQTKHTYLSITE